MAFQSQQEKMSDYIHLELQIEIIKRLPVKSLIKFRTVSKPWKSLIDSSESVADYTHQHEPLLLIMYKEQSDIKYISLLHNKNFPQLKFSTSPPSMSLDDPIVVGSSHGLLCIYSFYVQDDNYGSDMAVLWNPSIRNTVTIGVPKENDYVYGTVVSFGVCPITFDPMIVKITRMSKLDEEEYRRSCWEINVFKLSSRDWKTLSSNLPRNNIEVTGSCIAIDGFIYWCAYKRNTIFQDDINLIISFDMTSHEFKEIYLPDSLASKSHLDLSISKLRESVVVLEYEAVLRDEFVTYG